MKRERVAHQTKRMKRDFFVVVLIGGIRGRIGEGRGLLAIRSIGVG